MWFDPEPIYEEEEEEEWGEEEEIEEEEESVITSEDEWPEEKLKRKIPFWRGPSKLPQDLASEEEPLPEAEVFSSSSECGEPPKPRKPPKKFFEDPKFFSRKNKPDLPHEEWDEEENLDNIETLMKQTTERNELDAAAMMGVLTNLVPNFGYDDVIYKEPPPRPPSSADSNYDIVLSSSDEENVPKLGQDHYKEVMLADDKIIECQAGRKVCQKAYPSKYFGLSKILERKERIKNQKQAGTKSTLSSYMTVLLGSGEGASYCPSGQVRKKGWKLKEPFPKKDSIEKNISSSSTMDLSGSDSDRRMDDSRPGPSKVYPKCKWFEECVFKILFKLAVKREKKISTIKSNLDVDIDEILDDLFIMSRDARNHLIPKVTDDFMKYKNAFIKAFDQDRKLKKDVDAEEIKTWQDPGPKEYIDVGELLEAPGSKIKTVREAQAVSARLYQKVPRKDTPRASIEARLIKERSLDVKKRKNIIQKKFKPIEINAEALPQAMEAYYKEKEDIKRKRERDAKPPKDEDGTRRRPEEKKEDKAKGTDQVSLHPSYTKLIPPYSNVCKERIRKSLKKYRKAFDKELQSLADQETFALAGVALKRMYLITIGKGKPPVEFSYKEKARIYKILDQ